MSGNSRKRLSKVVSLRNQSRNFTDKGFIYIQYIYIKLNSMVWANYIYIYIERERERDRVVKLRSNSSREFLAFTSVLVSCQHSYSALKTEVTFPPKRRLTLSSLHCVISHKTELLIALPAQWEFRLLILCVSFHLPAEGKFWGYYFWRGTQ
jgi:hypothetical protein